MSKAYNWQKMKKRQAGEAETLLRSNERRCMNACHRFINRDSLNSTVWILHSSTGRINSLIVHAKQSLLPLLCGTEKIPSLNFLRRLFGLVSIHSVQGSKKDTEILVTEMEKSGFNAVETIDYDIMCIDHTPSGFRNAGPSGLVIRKPQPADITALAALHSAYEQEEVKPVRSVFNAAVSRLNIEQIFKKEQMLVAEMEGRLIGKINTNAVTFSRFQTGGVYVHPDFRGLGIARRMAGEFTASLIAQGRGISLFVKKTNIAARKVYQRIGFETLGDYRISYY